MDVRAYTCIFAPRCTLIFTAALTVILCSVFMFHGIRRGNIQYIIARRRAATGEGACLSQYFIEIYIAIYHGERRSRQGRRGAPIRGCILGGGV